MLFRASEEGCVVVTGAAGIIGKATAIAFDREGAHRLVLGDEEGSALQDTRDAVLAQNPRAKIEIIYLDPLEGGQVNAFYAEAVRVFGRINAVVNVGRSSPTDQEGSAAVQAYQRVLKTTFLSNRAALKYLPQQGMVDGSNYRGSIVNLATHVARVKHSNAATFVASQEGIVGLTKSDALDYGPDQIRVNCISTGYFEDGTLEGLTANLDVDAHKAGSLLGRIGRVEEIANAVVWLSSPYASFVTGAVLPVDGGYHLFQSS